MIIRVSRRARQQIREAATWWRENRADAPDVFDDELRAAIALLKVLPRLGAPARNVALEGVRRLRLRKARYYLYYRLVGDGAALQVLAVWHTQRGEAPPL